MTALPPEPVVYVLRGERVLRLEPSRVRAGDVICTANGARLKRRRERQAAA